jgi:hypothetical protein
MQNKKLKCDLQGRHDGICEQFEEPIRKNVWKLKANEKPCLVCLQTMQQFLTAACK